MADRIRPILVQSRIQLVPIRCYTPKAWGRLQARVVLMKFHIKSREHFCEISEDLQSRSGPHLAGKISSQLQTELSAFSSRRDFCVPTARFERLGSPAFGA